MIWNWILGFACVFVAVGLIAVGPRAPRIGLVDLLFWFW
jgi:hypothetical protein